MHFFFCVPILVLALLNTINGSGSDEGPAYCAGLRDGPTVGIFAWVGAKLSKGPG